MSLKDVLYILNLSINLLSGYCIYNARLQGSFNANYIYFKLRNKKIITLIITDGLYLVTYISRKAGEVTYPATDESI